MKDTRINKFLSQHGITSRRNAEILVKEKKVLINDQVALLGQKVKPNDVVKVNNQIINKIVKNKYYLINKPKKTICSLKDNFNRQIITDLIDDDDYLFPVGRLDYDTTGVLLITNDGELANKLIHPSSEIERIYRARLNEPLSYKELTFLNGTNVIINKKQSIQIVEQVDRKSYLISIKQGTYHHIKELFKLVDKKVLDLKRIMFAGLTCEKMMVGEYRMLKSHEIKKLKSLVK